MSRRARSALAVVGIVLTALCAPWPSGEARAQRGYAVADLEAAIIEKIVSFIRWPASANLDDPDVPFRIVVLGQSEVTRRLRALFQKRTVYGHRVEIEETLSATNFGAPHLLFVERAFDRELSSVLSALAEKPTLTMAHSPGFAERGVAVNLYQDRGRVRFEINRKALAQANLTASYQLLSLARVVGER